MPGLDWLTARPIAHRGLHDAAAGVIENMPSAFEAAIAARYAIECDLQVSADGEAMVHHDATLGRLTEGRGELRAMTAADLKRVTFSTTTDRMITLGKLCDLVDGRVPLVVELKSRFDAEPQLAARTADVLRGYGGPAAAMSFDPRQVEVLRAVVRRSRMGVAFDRAQASNGQPTAQLSHSAALHRV
jgi:glycerophosphoryl diester phosphodiesterase